MNKTPRNAQGGAAVKLKAICPRCGRLATLNSNGKLYLHRLGSARVLSAPSCPGSGYRVDEVKQMMRLEAKA